MPDRTLPIHVHEFRQQSALRMLGALHGPPIDNGEARRAFAWADAYWRMRREYERDRPRALSVRVQGGPVLWERGAG